MFALGGPTLKPLLYDDPVNVTTTIVGGDHPGHSKSEVGKVADEVELPIERKNRPTADPRRDPLRCDGALPDLVAIAFFNTDIEPQTRPKCRIDAGRVNHSWP